SLSTRLTSFLSLSPLLHPSVLLCSLFFFNHPAPTEIYTLSLHDALPIFVPAAPSLQQRRRMTASPRFFPLLGAGALGLALAACSDRKSTRLNSSHVKISYAVFCLKKKKKK